MTEPLYDETAGRERRVAEPEEVAFFSNIIVRTLMGVTLLLISISFAVLAYFVRPRGTIIVLHYNVYFGVDLLGVWWQAYIFPVFSLLFFTGHLFLAKYFYQRSERIAAYLLLLASGLIGFGVLIVSAGIAFINY